jgi:hypothetical protein
MSTAKKIIVVLIGITALCLLAFVVYNLLVRTGTDLSSSETALVEEQETTVFIPNPVTIPDPPGDRIGIQTNSGVVQVRNFFGDAKEKNDEYLLLASNERYDILYFREHSSFLISITAAPIQESRLAGEAELLAMLDIATSTSCKLAVSASVPGYVDENLAGTVYGLSYCD